MYPPGWLLCLIGVFAASALGASVAQTGVISVITSDGIQDAINVCAPTVINTLSQMVIPDISISSDSDGVSVLFELSNMYFQTLILDELWGTMSADFGISAGIDEGYIVIDFDWAFELLSYPFTSGSGSGEITVDSLYVSASFASFVDENYDSHTEATQSTCYIGSFGLSISSDDINTSLINILAQLLSPLISEYIGDFLGSALSDTISVFVNDGTAAVDREIDEWVHLDWRSPANTTYTDAYEDTPYTGFYFLVDGDSADVPFDPPVLPEIQTQDSFQKIVSLETFRTAWWCYAALDFFSNATDVITLTLGDLQYQETLTVAVLAEIFPDIERALQLDTPLTVSFDCLYPTVMEPLYSGVYVETPCELLIASEDTDVFQVSADIGLAEQARMYDTTNVGLEFFYHNHTAVSFASFIGVTPDEEETSLLLKFITNACVIPFFNDWGEHISFTLMAIGEISITEPEISFQSGYVISSFNVDTSSLEV